MATKLYPPQLEGTLPAFCKSYNSNGELIGASITVPFGLNRAVNVSSIGQLALRLRTASTNTYILSDVISTAAELEEGYAIFDLNAIEANKINESQYYRLQVAFIEKVSNTIGYYSTVGIIKCVAKPTLGMSGMGEFNGADLNFMQNTLMGSFVQNTTFGDSTEKVYSYQFQIWDDQDNLIIDSGERVHDITADVSSFSSEDKFEFKEELEPGKMYIVQYTVTTLNGLVVKSAKYKVMKTLSVEIIYPIALNAEVDYENGYINLLLTGEYEPQTNIQFKQLPASAQYVDTETYYRKASDGTYVQYYITDAETWEEDKFYGRLYTSYVVTTFGERSYSGTFILTRACDQDDYLEWQTIKRFALHGQTLSGFKFPDKTVQQGVKYKYALQQYNKSGILSNKTYLTYSTQDYVNGICERDDIGKTRSIQADFESMFLFDGIRQLKIKFNPKVSSFKNVIPEQKVETIGSKYPFIFRNGSVNYKEFPIEGLISFQSDEDMLFLQDEEWDHSGIAEYDYRHKIGYANRNPYITNGGHEYVTFVPTGTDPKTNEPTYRRVEGVIGHWQLATKGTYNNTSERVSNKKNVIRTNKDLTSDNIFGERYFKLKVLDWLTDGKVKLFRSPTEGNYLVRLLNVSLSPEDALGRMLHTFSCMAYEIGEFTYENLLTYGIVSEDTVDLYEDHWGSCDTNQILTQSEPDIDGWYQVGLNNTIMSRIIISDFAPGDQLKIKFVGSPEPEIFTVGVTGTINFESEERLIAELWIKPNPDVLDYNDFSRSVIYMYTGIQISEFDMVSKVYMEPQVALQYVGPKSNLLEPFNLYNEAYAGKTEIIGKNNIYNSLIARNNISYDITSGAPKFTALKIETLTVHKRDVIPIYAMNAVAPGGTLDDIDEDDLRFVLTPFGHPYINGLSIHEYYNQNLIINYKDPVVYLEGLNLDTTPGLSIKDLYGAFEYGIPIFNHFTIYQVFVHEDDSSDWYPLTTGKYQFYDTYTQSWMKQYNYRNIAYDDMNNEDEYYLMKGNIPHDSFIVNEIEYHNPVTKVIIDEIRQNLNDDDEFNTYTFTERYLGEIQYNPSFSINKDTNFNGYHTISWHYTTIDEATGLEIDHYYDDNIYFDERSESTLGDNNIFLVNESKTLYNLGEVEQLTLGNGVWAEVTFQLRVVNYEIEGNNDIKVNYTPYNPNNDEEELSSQLIGLYDIKQKYIDAKESFTNDLDARYKEAENIIEAQNQEAILTNKITQLQYQLDNYSATQGNITTVRDVAATRIIAQKQKAYGTQLEESIANSPVGRINQLNALVNLLKQIVVPYFNDDNNDLEKKALENVTYTDTPQDISAFDEDRPLNNRNIQLKNYNDDPEFLNTVDELLYEQRKDWETLISEAQAEYDKLTEDYNALAVSIGKLDGTYDGYLGEDTGLTNSVTLASLQNEIEALKTKRNELKNEYEQFIGEFKSELNLIEDLEDGEKANYIKSVDAYTKKNLNLIISVVKKQKNKLENIINDLKQKRKDALLAKFNSLDEKPQLYLIKTLTANELDDYLTLQMPTDDEAGALEARIRASVTKVDNFSFRSKNANETQEDYNAEYQRAYNIALENAKDAAYEAVLNDDNDDTTDYLTDDDLTTKIKDLKGGTLNVTLDRFISSFDNTIETALTERFLGESRTIGPPNAAAGEIEIALEYLLGLDDFTVPEGSTLIPVNMQDFQRIQYLKKNYPDMYKLLTIVYYESIWPLETELKKYTTHLETLNNIKTAISLENNNNTHIRDLTPEVERLHQNDINELKAELELLNEDLIFNEANYLTTAPQSNLKQYFNAGTEWNTPNLIYHLMDRYNADEAKKVLDFINLYRKDNYKIVPIIYHTNTNNNYHYYELNDNNIYEKVDNPTDGKTYYVVQQITEVDIEEKEKLILDYIKQYRTAQKAIPTGQGILISSVDIDYGIDYSEDKDYKKLLNKIDKINTNIENLMKEQDKVKKDLEKQQTDLKTLNSELEILTNKKATAIKKRKKATNNTTKAKYTKQIKKYNKKINEKKEEIEDQQELIHTYENHLKVIEAKINKYNNQIKDCEKEKADLEKKLENDPIYENPKITGGGTSIEDLVAKTRDLQVLIHETIANIPTKEQRDEVIEYINNKLNLEYEGATGSYKKSDDYLATQQKELQEEYDKIAKQIKTLQDEQTIIDNNRNICKTDIATYQNEKNEYEFKVSNGLIEGEALFNQILNDDSIRINTSILIAYMNWLNAQSKSITARFGDVVASGADTYSEYIDYLRDFIEIYEQEAFKLLHPYDALPEDLDEGFEGINGLDEEFTSIDNINMWAYHNILYLGDKLLPNENVRDIMRHCDTEPEAVLELFEKLKTAISTQFLLYTASIPTSLEQAEGNEDTRPNHNKRLGIIYYKTASSENYQYSLVEVLPPQSNIEQEYPQFRAFNAITGVTKSSTDFTANEDLHYHWVRQIDADERKYGPVHIVNTEHKIHISNNDEYRPYINYQYFMPENNKYYTITADKVNNEYKFSIYVNNHESEILWRVPIEGSEDTMANPNIFAVINPNEVLTINYIHYNMLYDYNDENIQFISNINLEELQNASQVIWDFIENGESIDLSNISVSNNIIVNNNNYLINNMELLGTLISDKDENGNEHNSLSALIADESQYRNILELYLKLYVISTDVILNHKIQFTSDVEIAQSLNKIEEELALWRDRQRKYEAVYNEWLAKDKSEWDQSQLDEWQQMIEMWNTINTTIASLESQYAWYSSQKDDSERAKEARTRLNKLNIIHVGMNSYRQQTKNILDNTYSNYQYKVEYYNSLLYTTPSKVFNIPGILQNENLDPPLTTLDKGGIGYLINLIRQIAQFDNQDINLAELYEMSLSFSNFYSKNILEDPVLLQIVNTTALIDLVEFVAAEKPYTDLTDKQYYTSIDEETYEPYRNSSTDKYVPNILYIIKPGFTLSLSDILTNLAASGPYMTKCKNIYLDTLSLYNTLQLEQDSDAEYDILQNNLVSARLELQRVQEYLENYHYISEDIDEEARIQKIKYALTDYLYYLSKIYIEYAEKRFGAIQ